MNKLFAATAAFADLLASGAVAQERSTTQHAANNTGRDRSIEEHIGSIAQVCLIQVGHLEAPLSYPDHNPYHRVP